MKVGIWSNLLVPLSFLREELGSEINLTIINATLAHFIAWPQALSSRKTTATGQTFSLQNLPSWLKLLDYSPIREVDTFRIKEMK